MRVKLSGTYELYDGTFHPNSTVIDTGNKRFSFGVWDYDHIQRHVINMSGMDIQYTTGHDSSGGLYENLRIVSHCETWYSQSIISRNRIQVKEFNLRTWDRKEIFLSMVYKHRENSTSDNESTIILLDSRSSTLLAELLESAIAKRLI